MLLLVAFGSNLLSGCVGLRLWEKGRYFTTERAADIERREISSIGIYVFSEGAPVDGTSKPFNGWDLVNSILSLPMALMGGISLGGGQVGISKYHYPSRIELHSTFEPDTANAGPSLELATALKVQLEERGYMSTVVTDLPHSGDVTVANCLKHAKENGYDAAFIVDYTGLKSWTRYAGETTQSIGRRTYVITHVDVFKGYLYLPHAALIDVRKSNEIVWRNSYYGIVERAHMPNFSSEPFTEVVSDMVTMNGDESYFKAAPRAAKMILAPEKWADSFKELPLREGARKRF